MPPKTEDIDNAPLTVKTIAGWGSAVIAILTLVISGVGAFDHLGNRIDLDDQRLNTLISERTEYRAQRDEQIKTLNARCDTHDRSLADQAKSMADVTARLAVIQAREEDVIVHLQKIESKVDGARADARAADHSEVR